MKQEDDQRIVELIQSMVDSRSTPEQVCRACPDLLPKVRERWKVLRRVEAEIDAIFPGSKPSGQPGKPARINDFPKIPGYEIGAVLGRGGMGIVYKAVHLKLNRVVALKMLLSGAYSSDRERKRFIREAKAIAQLKHPALVGLYNVGEIDSCPYYTMEFVAGGNLADKLGGVPQSPRFAAETVATLASAIHTAHQSGIIHRDLKPSNVLLCNDGSPKITDFGLARQVGSAPDLTQSGARVGTPCYMSPEQVRNRSGTVGPLADLYSLGAILYEMLTGRPPFRGESAADTERQIIVDETVPPSRLNSKVPRDLENVCLKCLEKDPSRRYLSTEALAQDLHRFQRGEPVLARPIGRILRAGKWIRRHPARAALLAAGAVISMVAAGGTLWFISANAERSRAVDGDLQQTAALEEQGSWSQADIALLRAKIELGNHGPRSLRDRLEAHQHELELVARLDQFQLHDALSSQGTFAFDQSLQDFTVAFRDAGLGSLNDDPDLVAERIRNSPIRKALSNALYVELINNPRPWKLKIAQKADPDPTGWRNRVLNPEIWDQASVLKECLDGASIELQPTPLLLAVATRYQLLGGDALLFLQKLQAQHSSDFWTNLELGDVYLRRNQLGNSIRYLQAAVSIRPSAAVAEGNLAMALSRDHQSDEAITHCWNAVHLDPSTAVSYSNLSLLLDQSGNHIQAIEESKRAIAVEPNNAWFHTVLGGCYRANGQKAEALEEYQKATSLKPQDFAAFRDMNACLDQPLNAEQRRARWQALLNGNPPLFEVWDGYAEFCLFLGQQDQYRKVRTALLKTFGDATDPRIAQLVARACLLLPGSDEETRLAAALIDRALSADMWAVHPNLRYYFNVTKALADYREGDFQSVVNLLRGTNASVLQPMPQLILAMANYRLGNTRGANSLLIQAIKSFDWSSAHATDAGAWIYHQLRREAEALIVTASDQNDKVQ